MKVVLTSSLSAVVNKNSLINIFSKKQFDVADRKEKVLVDILPHELDEVFKRLETSIKAFWQDKVAIVMSKENASRSIRLEVPHHLFEEIHGFLGYLELQWCCYE